MNVQDFTNRLTAHLRGLEDRECPATKDWELQYGGSHRDEAIQAIHLCRVCGGTGTIPHPHKAALRVVARPCTGWPDGEGFHKEPMCRLDWRNRNSRHERSYGKGREAAWLERCVCRGTGWMPRDVSWLDEPQYEPMLRGYYESIARACGWKFTLVPGSGWMELWKLWGGVIASTRVESTEAKAMRDALSRALME